jgi:hypothetical protein
LAGLPSFFSKQTPARVLPQSFVLVVVLRPRFRLLFEDEDRAKGIRIETRG